MPEGTEKAKFRTPQRTLEVVPRLWPDEYSLLEAVHEYVPNVPKPLIRHGWNSALHAYVPGEPLGYLHPRGKKALSDTLLRRIAKVMRRIAAVPAGSLPPLPVDWPGNGDSEGFLQRLVSFSEEKVQRRYQSRFGELFDSLGIPEDAVSRFRDRAAHLDRWPTGLTTRDFCLVHADLHRDNLILCGKRIYVLDWELALYGDPLHELATHVVRMGYTPDEQSRLIKQWQYLAEPRHQRGMDADLQVYTDFEYAQSVFADTMRAAAGLRTRPTESALEGAAQTVRRALRNAEAPLKLEGVPDLRETTAALRTWAKGSRRTRRWVVRDPRAARPVLAWGVQTAAPALSAGQ
ncbi:aminoglycoside phosphotransferase family protein [Streptomyces sp. NPDC051940]|uniref:phosphotransferase family protein n=1 Tax=Streptomyces sp. NPDC051940 TaxID=3155675 RepID=UPI003430AED4